MVGDIYKQTGGTGPFVDVSSALVNRKLDSITSTPNGDVYAVAQGGDIYKQTGGTGPFVAQIQIGTYWTIHRLHSKW